jgi:hypothetical protein
MEISSSHFARSTGLSDYAEIGLHGLPTGRKQRLGVFIRGLCGEIRGGIVDSKQHPDLLVSRAAITREFLVRGRSGVSLSPKKT